MTRAAPLPRDAGLTLIELLVAMAIFAVIGVAGLAVLDTVLNVNARTDGRLERLAQVDTVVFDKTGTLTAGAPVPTNLDAHDPASLSQVLALAEGSSHPLSRALTTALRARGVAPAPVTNLREQPGHGTEATLHDKRLRLGRATWVGAEERATTTAWLSVGAETPRPLSFTDALRPGAAEAVAGLKAMGLRVILISGDTSAAVAPLARELGIDDWTANALPGDKAERIADLQAQGAQVLMVGDGLNDTAALRAATVAISPASALDAARVASDIVLLGTDLSPLPGALRTARKTTRRIRENFRIATAYNVIAVPLAIAGLATPLIAALAMSTSSIVVSLNALRLR